LAKTASRIKHALDAAALRGEARQRSRVRKTRFSENLLQKSEITTMLGECRNLSGSQSGAEIREDSRRFLRTLEIEEDFLFESTVTH
jgi:hypothetical protein